MRAFAFQRVQVEREGGSQGFAFTRAQLGDVALMQVDAADELYIIMAHAKRALAGFAHSGECFRQKLVQALAFGETRAEFISFGAQSFCAEGFKARFKGIYRVHNSDQFSDGAFVLVTGEKAGNFLKH